MRISIRTLLTVPFLLLSLAPAGTVGYLFYSSSQDSVEEIAEDLFNQISDRTREQIGLYLSTPHVINQLNANSISIGELDLGNNRVLERYFVEQLRAVHKDNSEEVIESFNQSFNHIYIGTQDERFFGAEYRRVNREDLSTEFITAISRLEGEGDDREIVQYRADRNGDVVGERLDPKDEDNDPFELFKRPWYEKGVNIWNERGVEPVWSRVYCDDSTETPAITAVLPIEQNGELGGVLGSDFLFSDIEVFLKGLLESLEIVGEGQDLNEGKIFIFNSEGEVLVMTETVGNEKCVAGGDDSVVLPLASEMPDSVISVLANRTSNGSSLNDIDFKGQRYFWNSLDYQDEYDLSLKIVIAIPESSFKGDIQKSTERAIASFVVTLFLTATLAFLISRQLIQPVLKLKEAADNLTNESQDRLPNVSIENPSELHSLAQTFENMSARLQELLTASKRFVPQDFLTILEVDDVTKVQLGTYKRVERMSILFSDIRSFTSLSETMTPEQNFQFINSYLNRMEPAINENQGFIDKYIGDAIMALFEGQDSPDNAVKAGLGMLKRLAEFNEARGAKERPALKIGIGIHTGDITLGTLGGLNRWDTTVIGGDVNKASRVEGLTKRFGASLLASEQTLDLLQRTYHHRYLGAASVRGLDEPVKIYEIFEADPPKLFECKIKTGSLFKEALELYESQSYSQAQEKFEQVLEVCPEDGAAKFYTEACKRYLGQNPDSP